MLTKPNLNPNPISNGCHVIAKHRAFLWVLFRFTIELVELTHGRETHLTGFFGPRVSTTAQW